MLIKKNFWILLILLLAFTLRTIFLNQVPSGISNDELDYILNAKALFLTGSDISSTWNPLSLSTPKSSFPQAEIIPIITFLPIGILPLSLFSSKLIYALLSTFSVLMLYLLTKKLIGEKEALVVALVGACNPWSLYFGRTAYDTPVAILGFLTGLYILLISKGWRILLALPFFFIGFYGYIGAKLLFLPFVSISIFYAWNYVSQRKYTKQYVILFLLCLGIITFYFMRTLTDPTSRISELASPNMESIRHITNLDRATSIASPFTYAFSNKYVNFGKYLLEKYEGAFSPTFLFLHGDSKSLFTLWDHGQFYYLDILFLVIGAYALASKKKRVFFFLLCLILIAPIPSVISTVGVSYAIRSYLLGQMFIILIGCGIVFALLSFKKKHHRLLAGLGITAVYLILFINFATIYLLRNPVKNAEAFNFSGRVLSKYLSLAADENDKVFIITGNPKTPFKQFLFFTNSYNARNSQHVKDVYSSNNFALQNIQFVTCSNSPNDAPNQIVIIEAGAKCDTLWQHKPHLAIGKLDDGGTIYNIYNDRICTPYSLNRYPTGVTMASLNVESIPAETFCQTFIAKPSQ